MSLVIVPHPMGMIPLPEIRKKADNSFPEILKAAIQWNPMAQLPPMQSPYPAAKFKFRGPGEDVSRLFYDKGWSMGLPIIPPTPERVAKILKGTSRKPSEVIGIVPPRMGVLTVELAAIHAAMADCRAEYMPVLIAALEALLAPQANWRGAGTTTGTTAMLVIVNGPIVKEIGIAYGQGAAGKGNHANAAIGYAMNSIAYSVGGSKPPTPDKGTLSAPSDFTGWIFGENEDALPKDWEPFHV
ncbi:MAG: thiol-disulfide oxidoreductase, partial [Deltaproteobacteria bacterium]|nr:thiol-disulfide oxidoreductase [Deltaproteobacteria bacterium]